MTPDQYCQDKAAKSGSSFYYSFLFLSPERRLAITALYAFCREVDDVVDETADTGLARVQLAWWRTELDNMYAGKPTHPVTQAMLPFHTQFGLTAERLHAIIDGMEMDLDQTRYLDYPGLKKYCWHAAGVVGELAASIFGYSNPATLIYAEKLGLAFQLTNIIRDVGDDARRGRVYLPLDELQTYGITVADILNGKQSPEFQSMMTFQCARAKACYQEAINLLPPEDARNQRPGLMMASIYHALLCEIEADGFNVLNQRIKLTPLRKLWLAWKTYVTSGRSAIRQIKRG